MKIVIITNIPSPYRVDFFNYLINNFEHQIDIIYSSKNEDNRSWNIADKEIKNSHFLQSRTIKLKNKYDVTYKHIPKGLGRLLDELNPHVIVGSEYNVTTLMTLEWVKYHDCKYISWTDGTLNSEKNINFIQKIVRKYVIKRAEAYIGSSTKSREAQIAYGADPKKCYISLLTVDINKYYIDKNKTDGNTIVYVGQLIERKGIDLLLMAMKDVKKTWRLKIVGNGILRDEYEKLAQELEISEQVEFCGFLQQEQVKKIYSQCDIFVLPTREDCFGLVILEAMCAGLPVIVSKYADGVTDLVEDGVNGLIVDPYNKLELQRAVETLLDNQGKAVEMGMNSLKKTKKFTFENVSKQFIKAIEDVKIGDTL